MPKNFEQKKTKPIKPVDTGNKEAQTLSEKQDFVTDSETEAERPMQTETKKPTLGFQFINEESDYSETSESAHSIDKNNVPPPTAIVVEEVGERKPFFARKKKAPSSEDNSTDIELSDSESVGYSTDGTTDYSTDCYTDVEYTADDSHTDKEPSEPTLIQGINQHVKEMVAAFAPYYLFSSLTSPVKDWKVAATVFAGTAIAERIYFDLVQKEEPTAYYQKAAHELSLNRVIIRNVIKTTLTIGGCIGLGYQLSAYENKIPEWLASDNLFFNILGKALQEPYFVLTLGSASYYLNYKASWKSSDKLFNKCCNIPIEEEKFVPQDLSLKQYAGQQSFRVIIDLSMLMMIDYLSQAELNYLRHVEILIACDTLWKLMTIIEKPYPLEAIAFNVNKQMIEKGFKDVELKPATTFEKALGIGKTMIEQLLLAVAIYGLAGPAAGVNEDMRESNDINDHLPWISLALSVSLMGDFIYQHRTKIGNFVSSFFNRGSQQKPVAVEKESLLQHSPVISRP